MAENDDEKYYYNNYNYNKAHNELDSHVALATFARILGMFSIPLCLIFYTGIILGGVAVVLALLSKGTMKTFLPQAKKALVLGTVGVVLGYTMMVTSIHTVLTNPEQRQQLNTMSEQMYGTSFDDMLNEIKSR
ncbi:MULTISPECIES: hypothetical protein [unclassified Butyrivibrio]|jgi:xanthine/uracil permease|uniref:hypothetical protein n=1 Tax=unclassified Butyrivibrio TaxID=2639466 RepID=UPI00047BE261|nr:MULTISPECIES: hypothetical protein [unclassified Butyrivibrio]SFU88000.1 hypothetical protein SAMN05216540_11649 [Butyrivibrio sp. M55]